MNVFLLPLMLVLLIGMVCDRVIYLRLRADGRPRLAAAHAVVSVLCLLAIIAAILLPLRSPHLHNSWFVAAMYVFYAYLALYIPRIIALLLHGLLRRWWPRFARWAAHILGAILLAIMVWSAVVTPRQLNVEHLDVSSPRLPQEFDGFRIVHWSDPHLGTYLADTALVARQIDAINAQQPDLVCFTGDLVSRVTAEAEPFRNVLCRLQARRGVYAVLGNHDYDDYVAWPDAVSKLADQHALCTLEESLGWTLLRNDHAILYSAHGDSIIVAGCENYGEGYFKNYGDLGLTLADIDTASYTVLLQHNPKQWRNEIAGKRPVDLTLSGHTHAMQMMLTICGRRYSPAALLYDEWGGPYTDGDQTLHVSTGTGMVGMPARICATPVITVITLHRNP